jgi:hypothetical protein
VFRSVAEMELDLRMLLSAGNLSSSVSGLRLWVFENEALGVAICLGFRSRKL